MCRHMRVDMCSYCVSGYVRLFASGYVQLSCKDYVGGELL